MRLENERNQHKRKTMFVSPQIPLTARSYVLCLSSILVGRKLYIRSNITNFNERAWVARSKEMFMVLFCIAILKLSMVAASTADVGRLFHNGMVDGKNVSS